MIYIFMGTRNSGSGKKSYAYAELDKVLEGGKYTTGLYKSRLLGYEVVGTLIECEKTDVGVKGPFRIVQKDLPAKIDDLIAEWSATQRADLELVRIAQEAKKAHPKDIQNIVKDLKRATANMGRQQRTSFALWLSRELLN